MYLGKMRENILMVFFNKIRYGRWVGLDFSGYNFIKGSHFLGREIDNDQTYGDAPIAGETGQLIDTLSVPKPE